MSTAFTLKKISTLIKNLKEPTIWWSICTCLVTRLFSSWRELSLEQMKSLHNSLVLMVGKCLVWLPIYSRLTRPRRCTPRNQTLLKQRTRETEATERLDSDSPPSALLMTASPCVAMNGNEQAAVVQMASCSQSQATVCRLLSVSLGKTHLLWIH